MNNLLLVTLLLISGHGISQSITLTHFKNETKIREEKAPYEKIWFYTTTDKQQLIIEKLYNGEKVKEYYVINKVEDDPKNKFIWLQVYDAFNHRTMGINLFYWIGEALISYDDDTGIMLNGQMVLFNTGDFKRLAKEFKK